MHAQPLPALAAVLLASAAAVAGQRTIIPTTSFDSQADFDADWEYLYPWGTDHNGAARMDAAHVALAGDATLTLTAEPVTGEAPASSGGQSIEVKYRSGAVHARETFTVQADSGAGYDFAAEFRAPTGTGTWPAFWLTGVDSWPPEVDMAEWKGSGDISFNVFNTSSEVDAHDVAYPDPDAWHAVRCQLRAHNGVDVQVKYFLDGAEVTTQYGKDFVGEPFYLCVSSTPPPPSRMLCLTD